MEKIDLHIHSNISDGNLSVIDIIKLSKENQCHKIAITDHEKVNNYNDIAKENNISIINGIEFNSSYNGMHILGYGMRNIEYMKKTTSEINNENEEVCFKLIDVLYNNGFNITKDDVINYIKSIGLNYDMMDKKKIVKYLLYKGYVKTTYDAYLNLIGKGQKFYIPIKKLTPNEIIELIDKCGGVSVLAHPKTLKLEEIELLKKVKELYENGLDGIEIINTSSDSENTKLYKKVANDLKLICTVGSDFHNTSEQSLGVNIDEEIFYKLEQKIKIKNKKSMV